MENRFDARGWLREAKEALETARRLWEWQRWVALCQAAQLCIEYSARAVIACFAEPQWTHDPSEQLLPLLQVQVNEIRTRWGEEMLQRLYTLSADSHEAASWHGRSTYGGRDAEGRWRFPTDLCTQEVGERLLDAGERSFPTAQQFVTDWLALEE